MTTLLALFILLILFLVGYNINMSYGRNTLTSEKDETMPPLSVQEETESPLEKNKVTNENEGAEEVADEWLVFKIDDPSSKVTMEISMDKLKELEHSNILYEGKRVAKFSYTRQKFEKLEMEVSNNLENATFFSLVRNEDLQGILNSIRSVEDHFNSRYHYDWVFANDKPFYSTFKRVVSNLVSGRAHFVEIPNNYWSYPLWIDLERAEETRKFMKEKKVKYGDSESYRHMCRFNSGFFYRLPIMQNYRYYWRIEPDIEFRCDIFERDWFKYMRQNDKSYAFTLAPLELHTTVRNLWKTAMEFKEANPSIVAKDNNMAFLSEDGGFTYNMCHFWSNFEIGDMEFFRLEAYSKYFDHIDRAGGFYYSRWGDAPIHTIGVSMLLPKDSLLFLQNTGYYHKPNGDCPHDDRLRRKKRCICDPKEDSTWLKKNSCIPKWFEIHNLVKPSTVPQFKYEHQHKVTEDELEDEGHLLNKVESENEND